MIAEGTVIGGRYQIRGHIGRGGMQDVYRAQDNILGLDVALKTPQAGQPNKRFKNSAHIAAKVNHHNVAKTLDYFEEGGSEYLIEEFVDGETLEQKLVRFKYFDPHLAARVFHHLAKGIAASHRAGVVHRDLKPSNVMVTSGINVHQLKVTDFGIATLAQEVFDEVADGGGDMTHSNSGTIKGALPFMAPEMMFRQPGEHPGKPVDIWSLGAMMFKLLTGIFPFGVNFHAAVNVKNNHREPWPEFMIKNLQFAPLARELQGLVEACLTYEAGKRPSAEEVVLRCDQLCYLAVDRVEGTVNNMIQNGYSGFIYGAEGKAFFSKESSYGENGWPKANDRVCFSMFPGSPHPRAHPLVIINSLTKSN